MATAKKPDPNRGRRRKPAQPRPDAGQVPQPAPAVDAAADAPETGPLRRCIVTRESGPKEAMLRFVLDPDRGVVPDVEVPMTSDEYIEQGDLQVFEAIEILRGL